MNCTEAREAMLVAEPAEFRAQGGSELAAHIGECEACRSLARALAGDLDRLSSRIRARSRRRTLMLAALPIAAVLVATVTVMTKRADQPTSPCSRARTVRRASCRSKSASDSRRR